MAVDIAVLGLEVRSDGVVVASDRLKQLTAEGGKAEQATGKLSSSFSNLEKYVNAAQAAFAAAGIGMFVKSSIDAALQIERMTKLFNAATGSANLAARELEYVRGVTNKLGLDLVSTTESYGKFMAAIKGSTLEGERGRRVFESVSGATTALGLRADETAGVFKALEQMMSKGKVQAEELRGQLGERLPGAFKMAADAMGISTAQLDKNLSLGKVMAEDLLPALAVQLEKTYGRAATEGANSAQSAINRMKNAMLESKATVGSALIPTFTSLMENVLTPLAKLIGDIVRGLQSMAAAAALVWAQFSGGMADLFSGRLFTKEGYKQSMAEALINEQVYKEQMEEIWGGPKATDYTANELAKQSLNKPVAALADGKGAKEADRYRAALAELRGEIRQTGSQMTEYEQAVDKVNTKYDKLIEKYPSHRAELEKHRTEMLAATGQKEKFKIAADALANQIEAENMIWQQQLDDLNAMNQAYAAVADPLEKFRLEMERINSELANGRLDENTAWTLRQMEAVKLLNAELQTRNQLEDARAAAEAAEAALTGKNSIGGFDSIADQAANAMAIEKQRHEEKLRQIAKETEAYRIKATADKAMGKNLADYEIAQSRRSAAEKEQHIKNNNGIADKSFKSQLSMAGQYTSMAGQMFSALAETQDQTSREGFESAKALNIAAAVMNTASAIMQQLASMPGPAGWAGAALAAATGAIQIATIASTTFGGGAQAPSAPSGSFASAGIASGGASGFGNLTTPLMSVYDSQTDESLQRLTESTDNAAVAIGRLSTGIDRLTSLFSEGGAGMGLASNMPGRFADLSGSKQINPFGMTALMSSLKDGAFMNGVGTAALTLVTGGLSSVLGSLFGSENRLMGSGIQLAVKDGVVQALNYEDREQGSWWGGSKRVIYTSPNEEAGEFMQALVTPMRNEIDRMALALGTVANASAVNISATSILGSGATPEEAAKALEEWTLKYLQSIAMTVEGLSEFVGAYDDAYAKLIEYNNAVVSTNTAFELIGKAQLQGSLKTGEFLAAVQRDLFGGLDGFNEAVENYFSIMFTDAEQEAALAAQAQRDLDRAFAEMGQTIPATRQEFRDLVNSLDITTVSGAQLFAGLMDVSEAFGTMMDAADEAAEKLKEIQSAMQDLDVRYLKATGQGEAADALARQLSGQREIEQAIAGNMGDAYINRLREVLAAEAAATGSSGLSTATDNLKTAFSAEKTRLTDLYNAELTALNTRLTDTKTLVSTLTGYVNKLVSARQKMVLQDAAYQRDQYTAAQAMLAATLVAARGGDLSSLANMDDALQILTSQGADAYANSTDYQRDFWQTKNSITELEKLAGNQLTDAEKAVALAQQQIDLLKANHDAQIAVLDAQLNALLGINNSVLSLADAIAQYSSAKTQATQAAAQPARNAEIKKYVDAVWESKGDTLDARMEIYNAAVANGVSSEELTKAVGGDLAGVREWVTAMGLPMFADGGITSGISIAGESGPEAVVPLPDGRRIPVMMTGQADNAELIAEVRQLRAELRAAQGEIAKNTLKTARYIERWDGDGMPDVRAA